MATFPILNPQVIHPPAQRTRGWIHSWETSAGQDGPGWRLVVYLSGCLLRCLYCHNPDTWNMRSGTEMSLDALWDEIDRYRPLLRKGGITFTGGEPLVQAPFLRALLRRAKEERLHTAVDTAGFLGDRVDDEMMRDIDLVLLDIKCWNPETYLRLTGKELEPTLRFARRLAEEKRPVWLRYVLVPDLTDEAEDIDGLAAFAASLGNVERVDVLPFHQLGKTKWAELGLEYRLKEYKPPAPEEIERAIALFRAHGLSAC
jgi:pyruvate formate lyase activating enzyme